MEQETTTFTASTSSFSLSIPSDIIWRHPVVAIFLSSFCIITVTGNLLVVAAVCTKKYLRNPTGFLIISLALADLIVGLAVMPLNSLFEMTNHTWLLGSIMCDIFHALDVLASTSSIWNLCVISLDRYLAGQDPIGYRDKVNKKRILMCICAVWLMSAVLSFPAIYWWRSQNPELYDNPQSCVFPNDPIYIGFSSLVSFYVPLCLILFSYGKVFLIATRHSEGMRRGIKKVKYAKGGKSHNGETDSMLSSVDEPTLRVHFGRGRRSSRSLRSNGREATRMLLKQVSCKSLNDGGDRPRQASFVQSHGRMLRPPSNNSNSSFVDASTRPRAATTAYTSSPVPCRPPISPNPSITSTPRDDPFCREASLSSTPLIAKKKLNVREKSRQMMKYVHEQRAARTLSIVVGAFIICWTPFFIFVPLSAFGCKIFANEDYWFTIFTWAGHLNSMLNPLIYSRFSRDFRRAFKQILTCQRRRKVKTAFQTPLSLVFTQLISVTQMWEQTHAGSEN